MKESMFTFTGREEHRIDCTYLQQEGGSDTVCFVFPGRAYTNHHPVMYYSSLVLQQNGLDVVEVNYRYKDIPVFGQDEAERDAWICADMARLVQSFLQEHPYQGHVFLGKSLGTYPTINAFSRNPRFADALYVHQTPILLSGFVYRNLLESQQKSLVIIGDKDPCYDIERINELKTNPNIELLVLENANHALEVAGDAVQSAGVLHQITRNLDGFIKKHVKK